jgi:hypothetical protein
VYKEDEFECVGWHMYMSPESAYKGLKIFNSDRIKNYNEPCGSSELYGDLRKQNIYKKYVI